MSEHGSAVSGDLLHRRGGKKIKQKCTGYRRHRKTEKLGWKERGETDSMKEENGIALNSH